MTDKIKGTIEAWESGKLGRNETSAESVNGAEIDESLELQMISIRLPKSLIDDLKIFATLEGLGYQPLIRRVLIRWVEAEKKMIANQAISEMIKEQKSRASGISTDDDNDGFNLKAG